MKIGMVLCGGTAVQLAARGYGSAAPVSLPHMSGNPWLPWAELLPSLHFMDSVLHGMHT